MIHRDHKQKEGLMLQVQEVKMRHTKATNMILLCLHSPKEFSFL